MIDNVCCYINETFCSGHLGKHVALSSNVVDLMINSFLSSNLFVCQQTISLYPNGGYF